ncbi:MAG: hypothetical protein OEU46_13315 [Alphaproteobacteria bacterium]|nr:hypothetical protein [Alphaproteobacteria bacterium]
MAALTQKAWYEDRYSTGEYPQARIARQSAARHLETQDATIRFVRSQIGTLAATAAQPAQAPILVDF